MIRKTSASRGLGVLLLTLVSATEIRCSDRHYIVPTQIEPNYAQPRSMDNPYYKNTLFIPINLQLDNRYSSSARSCAILYNEAIDTLNRCDATAAIFRVSEVTLGVLSATSAAFVDLVQNPAASKHWKYSSIISPVLLTLVVSADVAVNCSAHLQKMAAVASGRQQHLQNASHLLECDNKTSAIAALRRIKRKGQATETPNLDRILIAPAGSNSKTMTRS